MSVHTCDRCGTEYAHRIAALWCCPEGAWDDNDDD